MIIYETTNLINGRIYIGLDTKNDFSYYGSGKYYKRAEKKYGKENFRKATIDSDENLEVLYLKEIFWIADYRKRGHQLYNVSSGGDGGDTFSNNPNKEEIRQKIINFRKGKPCLEEIKQKISKTLSDGRRKGKNHHMYGKKNPSQSERMKGQNNPMNRFEELRIAKSIRMSGENHPMYGKKGKDNHNYGKMYNVGENHPMFGKKRPEHSRKMMGQNNPMSRTNKEKRKKSN